MTETLDDRVVRVFLEKGLTPADCAKLGICPHKKAVEILEIRVPNYREIMNERRKTIPTFGKIARYR